MSRLLQINASMRREGSVTRSLTAEVVAKLSESGADVIVRDLTDGIELIDEAWITANFTPEDERTEAQKARLALSDTLVAELKAADTIVIGSPVYNFGVPGALKAWVDLVARARVTFRYTDDGPVGLLDGKRAIIVTASGGTPVDGAIDFATPYLRHTLGFLGIKDVTVIAADQQMVDPAAARSRAEGGIHALAA
ncbi:MAG: NAD(P)H-dependent oxidoreductase [Pseudomonadota bacterium]